MLRLLNEALATEIVCTLHYRRHYFVADGLEAEAVKQEFLTHAEQEILAQEEEHAKDLSSLLRGITPTARAERALR